jgi:hypothetical protein
MTTADLLLLAITIALGFLLAVAFYESLSTRDVLVARTLRIAGRISRRRWFVGAAYILAVGIGVPVLVLVWATVLELALFVVGSVDRVDNVVQVSVAVVAAARILAYVREKTSHELAKAVPLSFAFLLLTGGAINLEQKLARLADRPDVVSMTTDMVVLLVSLEVGLRVLTDSTHAVMRAIRRRRGSDGTAGFWRTLVGAASRTGGPVG